MKSVIIYTYVMSESNNFNLKFFVNNEIVSRPEIDYVIVINGYDCDTSINFPILENLTVLRRENKGFDFGGHYYALNHLKNNNKEYDYYFFLNSGVIGPILPHYFNEQHWTNIFIRKINDKVKLVGTTIVCLPSYDSGGYGPKVEGFFFMVDKFGLSLLENEKTIFCDHETKYSVIINGEYGLSNCIFKNGYTIDCMIRKYQGIDWTNPNNYNMNNNKHPSRYKTFYGESINPYEVIFHKWHWNDSPNVNIDIIRQYVNKNT